MKPTLETECPFQLPDGVEVGGYIMFTRIEGKRVLYWQSPGGMMVFADTEDDEILDRMEQRIERFLQPPPQRRTTLKWHR